MKVVGGLNDKIGLHEELMLWSAWQPLLDPSRQQ